LEQVAKLRSVNAS